MTDNTIHEKIINIINLFNKGDFNSVIKLTKNLIKNYKNIPVLYNLHGASLAGNERHEQAIEFYSKAIALEPQNEEVYRNLSKSLIATQKFDEAIKYLKKSITINNVNPDAYFNLGLAFSEKKLVETSIKNFKIALKQKSNFAECYYNLGNLYLTINKYEESIFNFKKAILINKNYFKAFNNLGTANINLENYDQAIYFLNEALKINSKYPEALSNLGVAYLARKEIKIAIEYFNKALSIDPNFLSAITQKLYAQRVICDWSEIKKEKMYLDKLVYGGQNITPWQLLSLEDNPERQLNRAKNFSKKFFLHKRFNLSFNNSKIKIGYFAPDFFEHAGMMSLEGVFLNHDKSQFEIFAFDYGPERNDNTHKRIKTYFDNFFYVKDYNDKEIAYLAKENRIDIAIHRNGHCQNSRSNIFSFGAAPLQVNYHGYAGTTGLDSIDYIIGDKITIPEENQKYYSEKIIYMPNTYFPANNTRKISEKIFLRSSYGIPKEAFTFCCFNNSYKISRNEFDIWMKLLNKIEGSYLLLLLKDELTKKNLQSEAEKKNINPNRLKFFDYINVQDHLSRHSLADLYLDTFNYNAHTSGVDALWTGVPLITKQGNSFAARACASLLNAFGMNELITSNEKEYERLAVELASNKKFMKEIKNKVLENKTKSKLFNTKEYVRDLEKAFKLALKYKVKDNSVDNIFV